MTDEEKQEIKESTARELAQLEKTIAGLKEATKPLGPDNAIGRLTRMEAINSKAVHEYNLSQAVRRKNALKELLNRIDSPGFGICTRCGTPIPPARLAYIPESTVCVNCS